MGYSVLLSNYRRYFKLAAYLSTFTQESIVIALGLPSLVVRPASVLRAAQRWQAVQGGSQQVQFFQHSRCSLSSLSQACVGALSPRCRRRHAL